MRGRISFARAVAIVAGVITVTLFGLAMAGYTVAVTPALAALWTAGELLRPRPRRRLPRHHERPALRHGVDHSTLPQLGHGASSRLPSYAELLAELGFAGNRLVGRDLPALDPALQDVRDLFVNRDRTVRLDHDWTVVDQRRRSSSVYDPRRT